MFNVKLFLKWNIFKYLIINQKLKTMRKLIFILLYFGFCTFTKAQIEIISNGNCGINQANPANKLHVLDNNNEIQLLLENNSQPSPHERSGAGI